MPYRKTLVAAGLLLGATFNANASLTSYTANGVDFVRMQGGGFDVSFTKDGNLLQTLAASNPNLLSQIIAVTPTYNDPVWGVITINTIDILIGNWWGAIAFVNYLNNISYGGSNQWSLPGWTDTGAAGPQFGNNGTDYGLNVNPSSSPLAQLYYSELNKIAWYNTSGEGPQSGYGIFGNDGAPVAGGAIGPFINVRSFQYWLGEYAPNPYFAWVFGTHHGSQVPPGKDDSGSVWVVSPGQVAAVPVPGAVWLMGSSLLGLLSLKRREHAG